MAHIGIENMGSGSLSAERQQQGSGGGRVTVLPLNLLALIISYVRDFRIHGWVLSNPILTFVWSSMIPRTLHESVRHAEFCTT